VVVKRGGEEEVVAMLFVSRFGEEGSVPRFRSRSLYFVD
jgi:hypothetical protein